eukprot:TRINITY_DN23168_c0_g2_i2.p1 TRINITY_DN23168_c0_g2~~TRINITY_DN23168_c0_g2_i2.p1  ORF type:complete len:2954 (+),score=526.87 TRINITY_DN23168_c0_g2_i2:1710-10571(+)
MVDPCTENAMLITKETIFEESVVKHGQPFVNSELRMSSLDHGLELSIKVVLQPFEVTYDSSFLFGIMDFHHVLSSVQFQHERVLASLNRFENFKARVLSKAEYIFSSRTRILWDVSFNNVIIKIPWRSNNSELYIMVVESGAILFKSVPECDPLPPTSEHHYDNFFLSILSSTYPEELSSRVQDIYDYFKIDLTGFEVNVIAPNLHQDLSIIERFNASVSLGSCMFLEESMLKQLEVHANVPSFGLQFSPSVYDALVKLSAFLDVSQNESELVSHGKRELCNEQTEKPSNSNVFKCSVSVNVEHAILHVNLENDLENSLILAFSLGKIDMQYDLQEFVEEFCACIKALEVSTSSSKVEGTNYILCSSRDCSFVSSANQSHEDVELRLTNETFGGKRGLAEGCLLLQYQSLRSFCRVSHRNMVCMNGVDLHCHPRIIGLLQEFYDKLSRHGSLPFPSVGNSFGHGQETFGQEQMSGIRLQKYGFSNYCETGSFSSASIPLDCFPFVTIYNSGSLGTLENSLVRDISEWRSLHVKDREFVRSQPFISRKRSRMFSLSTMKSISSLSTSAVSESSDDSHPFVIDFNLNDIQVYFHDSSCVLATMTVPSSISSVFVHGFECWDILGSTDGLLLSSSWSNLHVLEFIYGPASPNCASILNFLVRKGKGEQFPPEIEICIGIQRICCNLSSEVLSILISYFSLPDWKSSSSKQPVADNHDYEDVCGNNNGILIKVEILDSILILPVENNTSDSIQLGLQQLYCSSVTLRNSTDALKDIPHECVISTVSIFDTIQLVNVFGRGISLSLLLLEDDRRLPLKLDEYASLRNISLIETLDADLWVRIPGEYKFCGGQSVVPSYIMMRTGICQVIAEEDYFFYGLEAVIFVIDHLSTIGRESQGFTTDVLQFVQFKRSLKESNAVLLDSRETFTETRFCINGLSISLYPSRRRLSMSSELVAKADMQLIFTASFRNEIPLCIDVDISRLVLYSYHSSVILVACSSSDSVSSYIGIHYSKSDGGENQLLLSVPSLDIWLHLSDWSKLIELIGSCALQLRKSSSLIASYEGSKSDSQNDTVSQKTSSPENFVRASVMIVKSENLSISFHFPVWVDCLDNHAEVHLDIPPNFPLNMHGEKAKSFEAEDGKYIVFTLHSRFFEIVIGKKIVKLKSNIEKIRGLLEVIENQKISSLPCFQIFQVNIEGEVCDEQIMHVSADVELETLDVWLSHQIFCFWRGIRFRIPETSSPPVLFCNLAVKAHLRKVSVLLNDGRWSCNGPIMEIFMRKCLVHIDKMECVMEASVTGELQVNYNNIHKVMWEPFMEPWSFQLKLDRKREQCALLNTSVVTDIHLESTAQLNLNITEPLIEAIFRGYEMIRDAWGQVGVHESLGSTRCQATDNVDTRRYAPYILQNDTSMPLFYWVSHGPTITDDTGSMSMKQGNIVQPSSSVAIYINESPEELIYRSRPGRSSEKLNEKKSGGVAHHMISVQLDGTSGPSLPMSMDLVGIRYFDVDFSKPLDTFDSKKDDDSSRQIRMTVDHFGKHPSSGFIVPVVFEVSIQHYSKLIRLYSTVILFNATSVPLELRFDIPFGVSPKVLDPIYPGQELPLPVHLAEAGRIRWRPLGTDYLWSEAHPLSSILSQENRLGFLRSFVCYPSHPSSDPFRCCLAIQDISPSSFTGNKKSSAVHIHETSRQEALRRTQRDYSPDERFIHHVRLTSPLLVKNYLPKHLSLTIESGGITRTAFLSEVNTASIFHIDSTHDLGIMIHVDGFRPTISKFPRGEAFASMAKLNESKFSLCETLTFYPDESNGPICVNLEKVMDAFCGAREICISIPFLLYNCTGLSLAIADCGNNNKGNPLPMPSCYQLIGQEQFLPRKQGVALASSQQDSTTTASSNDNFVKKHTISLRESAELRPHGFLISHLPSTGSTHFQNSMNGDTARSQLNFFRMVGNGSHAENGESRKVQAFMFSPPCSSPAGELMVSLSTCSSECGTEYFQTTTWSSPFYLVPASGSTTVVIPEPCTTGAFILSVTSSPAGGALGGRTRAITFQPRYVISNACSEEICYKQKGTNFFHRLGIGQHSHLHWADMTRELLVSIRFNEPGWQWSGSFLPDHLGDSQLKLHNYVSGALNLVRVEVQNADVSIGDEKIVGSSSGNLGTHLILLSDDNTGFMPYRIDNFSMERLRIYQQRCETFETIVHSYTCCPYAWDEPCYPHRLVVEVPGERVIGSYSLDDVTEYLPVHLPSTPERPERRFFLSVHAEGAIKVLSIVDTNHHIPKDMKEMGFPGLKGKKKLDQKETHVDFTERITLHLSFIGISLMNSFPQELVFVCSKETKIVILQSLDQQKFSFQMSSLQIDNQLRNTPYPVILSFEDNRNETISPTTSKCVCEPIFHLYGAKWRKSESSLVSFEYINIRLSPLRIELEEQVLLSVFDFVRSATSTLQSRTLQHQGSELQSLDGGTGSVAHVHDYDPMSSKTLGQIHSLGSSSFFGNNSSPSIPSVVPIGAPWQQIFLLARRQKKIYVEVLDLAPIKLTLSFSSVPWMPRNEGHMAAESLVHVSSTAVQRGLMALVDVEGAPVYLRQLTIAHHMASWESIQEILIRHYTRQLLHEIYKVFGSAGVIGNPMGFARNVGLGIKDFLSVPAKGVFQSPAGLITGMAQGTKSLLSNTVYAVSNAATQFSKAAHKSIVAFTFDEQTVANMEDQKGLHSPSKGLLNEFLEGLTGLLQSPIRGAEKHGLPGVLSGIALGATGLVARPVASILEVTGKTAQSIRNRSSPHQPNRFRIRLPRPLARELPLVPYSWEEAIGISVLLEADNSRLKDEIFVMCKALKQAGKFIIITKRLMLIVKCSSLVGFGSPDFVVVADPERIIEMEIGLEGVIHIDREVVVVNIVGSSAETLSGPHQLKQKSSMRESRWGPPASMPLFQTSIEFVSEEDAEDALQALWSVIEQGKERRWGVHVFHQINLR